MLQLMHIQNILGFFLEEDLYKELVSTEGVEARLAYEVGHIIDVTPKEIVEETNNVLKEYSEEVIDKYRRYRDADYDFLVNYMAPENISTLLRGCDEKNVSDCKGVFTSFKRYKFL